MDPLSWFTGPYVPLALAGLVLIDGGTTIAATWSVAQWPAIQLLALALCIAAPLTVHWMARPLRRAVSWGGGAGALALSVAGVVCSAIGYGAVTFPLDLWWAPIALGLAIVSLGPHLPGRVLLALGVGSTVLVVAVTYTIVHLASAWGPVATAVIIATPPTLCLAAMITFSYR
ncbi:MAG: hypothetical protein ABL886_12480, partial [Rhodoglobus sp.]